MPQTALLFAIDENLYSLIPWRLVLEIIPPYDCQPKVDATASHADGQTTPNASLLADRTEQENSATEITPLFSLAATERSTPQELALWPARSPGIGSIPLRLPAFFILLVDCGLCSMSRQVFSDLAERFGKTAQPRTGRVSDCGLKCLYLWAYAKKMGPQWPQPRVEW